MLAPFQEGLEDKNRGKTVDCFPALANAHFAFAEHPVGFHAGETFVPKVYREGKLFPQQLGELTCLLSGGTLGAAQTEGQTDDDLANFILRENLPEGREVGPLVLAKQGRKPLGGDAEWVGNGKAYAPGTKVDGKNSPMRHRRLC